MIETKAYAATRAGRALEPYRFTRRELGPHDVLVEIHYSGICHSDIHQARDEWGGSVFPMVPGHEIAGRVSRVGAKVKRFRVGDNAGVGCFVDSCRKCPPCRRSQEQFCATHVAFTYNSTEMDLKTVTYGGYSTHIVVDEHYAFKIARGLPLDQVAPLMCAGITTYSPLRQWKVGPGTRVGIFGLGGLGHMALKLAVSLGAEVTVFSTSPSKAADARRMGAHHFVLTKDPESLTAHKARYDFFLDTVSAPHDLNACLSLLDVEGTMVLVGVPPKAAELRAFSLILGNRRLAGSLIGGIRQTQEMLDYCAKKKLFPEVEVIAASQINKAYDRMIKGDVRYRFVIDAKTF